jgi:hypothetical protein
MKTLFIFSLFFLFSCFKTNYKVDKSLPNSKIESKRELETLIKNKEEITSITPNSVKDHELILRIPKTWERKRIVEDNKDLRILFEKNKKNKIIIMSNQFEGTEEDLLTVALNISFELGAVEISNFYKANSPKENLYFSYAKLEDDTIMGVATILIKKQGYLFFCLDETKKLSECSSIIKTLNIGSKND